MGHTIIGPRRSLLFLQTHLYIPRAMSGDRLHRDGPVTSLVHLASFQLTSEATGSRASLLRLHPWARRRGGGSGVAVCLSTIGFTGLLASRA